MSDKFLTSVADNFLFQKIEGSTNESATLEYVEELTKIF